jgi:hypothetical protein
MAVREIGMYDTVQVVKLLEEGRYYRGSCGAMRPPQVGDTGTVVEIESRQGGDDLYYVEAVDEGGSTIWLAAFQLGEISPIT